MRFFPPSDPLHPEHSSTDLRTETDTMLSCVSLLYNQKNPTHTPSYSLIFRASTPPPALATQPEQTGLESLWKPSPETWQGCQTFFLYLGQLPKIFLSLQKKKKASRGLEADRIRNINKIWRFCLVFREKREKWQRQIYAKRKPQSFGKEERRNCLLSEAKKMTHIIDEGSMLFLLLCVCVLLI